MQIEAFSDDGYILTIDQDTENPSQSVVEIRHETRGHIVEFSVPTAEVFDVSLT